MTLANFRLRAAIDRVHLAVTLGSPTQFRHFKARLPAGWVTSRIEPAPGENHASCRMFSFWLQDPPHPEALAQQFAESIDPDSVGITGIEIALDAWPRTKAAHGDLVAAALHLFHHHASPSSALARVLMPDKREWAKSLAHAANALGAGLTLRAGQRDYGTGTYVKTYDSLAGQAANQPLPAAEHRARFEITLAGPACPFSTLPEWQSFNFGSLGNRFAMVKPSPPRPPTSALLSMLHSKFLIAPGLPVMPGPLPARRRTRLGSQRDTPLNRRIQKALARLNAPGG